MTHSEYMAVERFATKLKVDLPILEKPKDFTDRIMNMCNENIRKIIDLELGWAEVEFNKEAEREAEANEK